MINILTRTSNRPLFFADCMKSISKQTYRRKKVIIGSDCNDSYPRIYNPISCIPKPRNNSKIDTAVHFPYNSYLNKLLAEVKSGYVMILDDDDMFYDSGSLSKIMSYAHSDNVIFWRVNISGRIVPSDYNFGKEPVKKDISSIGFAFPAKYIPLIWIAPYKQMDYRLALDLYHWGNPIFINQVLTKTQRTEGEGMGHRKDKR